VGEEAVPEKGNLPVFSITVTEAHCYARWLGGFLPSEREWLKASGYLEPADKRGEGPYHSSSDPGNKPSLAIDREGKGPLPVGEAKDDVNIFGCHDMAGNGYEWTR